MNRRLSAVVVLVAWLAADSGGFAAARAISVVSLLDRYLQGQFDAVVADMDALPDTDAAFLEILTQLKRDGPRWIDADGANARARRELAAATFALEAARLDEWREWKWVATQPLMSGGGGGFFLPPPIVWWKPPPLLIEWGCQRFRADETPRPIERLWQLAALSVAQRAEDFEFLIGNQWEDRSNDMEQIAHLDHVLERFPFERRFDLAQGIAVEWFRPTEAAKAFENLKDDVDVGAEAMMRIGDSLLHDRKYGDAIKLFDRAQAKTREPYVVYLTNYLKGQALEHWLRATEAEASYRRALAVVPRAQSASVALSALLIRRGRRVDAQQVTNDWVTARPTPVDPFREMAHADDRFWPGLIQRLREEIRR